MATTVGALSVDLDLNSANFINNLKRSTDAVDKSAKSMSSALDAGKTAVKGLIAAFTFDAIATVVKDGLDFVSSLGEQAQQLGITTRELQVYRYAASQVGIATDDMEKGLAKLTLRIGQAADGNKQISGIFSELGISVLDASGHARSAGDVFEDLADRLAKIPDPAKRAEIEVALFGKTGQQLDTLLAGGSKAIDEMAAAADRLGIVLDDHLIQQADEAADKLAAVKQVLEAKMAAVIAENAEGFFKLADAISFAVDKLGEFFVTMKGVERLQRDQGWARGFFSGWNEQLTAADPVKYVQQRTDEMRAATARRQSLERQAANGGNGNQRAILSELAKAKAAEAEALRLLRAAQSDPDFQARLRSERARTSPTARATGAGGGTGGGSRTGVGGSSDIATIGEMKTALGDMFPGSKVTSGYRTPAHNKAVGGAANSYHTRGKGQAIDFQAPQGVSIKDIKDAFSARGIELTEALDEGDHYHIAWGGGSKGGASRGGRSGPSLSDRFSSLQDRLDPMQAANREYEETIRLLDEAEKSGLKAAHGFDALREAARDNLMDRLGLEDVPLALETTNEDVLELKDNIDVLGTAADTAGLKLGGCFDPQLQEDILNIAQSLERDLAGGLADVLVNGGDIGDVLANSFKRMAAAILEAVLQAMILKPLLESLGLGSGGSPTFGGGSQGNSGGILSFVNTIVGSLFGGGRATGGDVAGNRFYVVGENGPELFAPGVSGAVLPNAALRRGVRGGDGMSSITFNFHGPVSNPEQVRRSAAQAGAQLARMVASGKRGV